MSESWIPLSRDWVLGFNVDRRLPLSLFPSSTPFTTAPCFSVAASATLAVVSRMLRTPNVLSVPDSEESDFATMPSLARKNDVGLL